MILKYLNKIFKRNIKWNKSINETIIFEAIESSDDKPKPKLTDENLIINELIR